MAKKRPIIKWTGTSGGKPPPRVEVLQLPPFRGATDPPSEDPKIYEAWISALGRAGSMFTVTVPLYEEYLPKYYTQPAYPVLMERMTGRSSEPIAKIGTVAVFAGSIRSEERKKDATLRLLRHTFIIGTGCYIIPTLACLKPVIEELRMAQLARRKLGELVTYKEDDGCGGEQLVIGTVLGCWRYGYVQSGDNRMGQKDDIGLDPNAAEATGEGKHIGYVVLDALSCSIKRPWYGAGVRSLLSFHFK